MPEGPTVLNISQQLQQFKGKKVMEASGYGPMQKDRLEGAILKEITTHGKYLIFRFTDFFVTAHFGLFGSMLLNERKEVNASFALHFAKDEINFYVTKTKLYEGKPAEVFDDRTDILSQDFDRKHVLDLVHNHAESAIGDVLMDQSIFAGVGNIIRVESLYRAKIHPESLVAKLSKKKLAELISETVKYAKEFLAEIPAKTVKSDALVYGKKICPKHKIPLTIEKLGKVKRKTYWCEKCQKLA